MDAPPAFSVGVGVVWVSFLLSIHIIVLTVNWLTSSLSAICLLRYPFFMRYRTAATRSLSYSFRGNIYHQLIYLTTVKILINNVVIIAVPRCINNHLPKTVIYCCQYRIVLMIADNTAVIAVLYLCSPINLQFYSFTLISHGNLGIFLPFSAIFSSSLIVIFLRYPSVSR